MTELSLNAQAIFDAVWNEPTYDPGGWEVTCRIQIAAAFRAAVDRLSYQDSEGQKFIYEPELLAIADELSPLCEEYD